MEYRLISAKKGKKKAKKGKFKVTLSVTASGNANYLNKTQEVVFTVRVK